MKLIVSIFLALLVVSSPGLAQWSPWTAQSTGLPTGYYLAWIYAVNDSIAWGTALTNEGGPAQYFSRTTNGGATWTSNTITGAPASYFADYVYSLDARRAWITMPNADGGNTKASGALYSTTDGGATWIKDTTAFASQGGFPDFVYFFDANTGVAVGDPAASDAWTNFEIYRTSNGGTTWSRVPKANIPASPIGEYGVAGEFSGTGNSLWFPTYTLPGSQARYLMTTDKGLTWSAHIFPLRSSTRLITVLEFQNDSVGLGQGSEEGVMKTTDGGLTWTLIPNTSWLSLRHLEYVPGTSGMYVATSPFDAQSPTQKNIWATVITTDGGATWTRIGQGATENTDLSFGSSRVGWRTWLQKSYVEKFSISPGRLIGVCPDSVSYPMTIKGKSADTVAIDIANYGTDPLQVTGIVPPDSSFTIILQPTFPLTLTTLQSARLTLTFTPKAGGMFKDSVIVISNTSNLVGSRLFLSGEGFSAQVTRPGLLYAASSLLFTIDTKTGMITRIDSLGTLPIHSLAADWSEYGLYGVSAQPIISTLYRIDCKTGSTMFVCTFPVGNLRAIAFSRDNILYGATTTGALYQLNTTTGTATYMGESSDVKFTSLAFSPSGKLWASGEVGTIYDNIFTVNTGTGEVALVGRAGRNLHVSALAFDPKRGNLYGLTGTGADTNAIISIDTLNGAGMQVFSTGMTGLVGIAMNPVQTGIRTLPVSGVPQVFALEQNYPNPFNPTTVIRFSVPTQSGRDLVSTSGRDGQVPGVSDVNITVFDLLGREVKVLVNERKAPGVYEVSFDASGLSSGVYFYRMTAGNFVQTRRMMLIK